MTTKAIETRYHHYICLECGEIYYSTDPQVTLYCSRECEQQARMKGDYLGAECYAANPYDLSVLETRLCAECGERFVVERGSSVDKCIHCIGRAGAARRHMMRKERDV